MDKDDGSEQLPVRGDANLGEVGRITVPASPAAGPLWRVALPAALAVVAWFVLWTADNICLRELARYVGYTSIADRIWPRIPALVLLPRFGWLLFPVLLLCIHLCARVGGGTSDRTVVVLAPAVVAPFVYWQSLEGLVAVTMMPPGCPESVGLYRARWDIIFFTPEYVALVLMCVSALVIYALAPRALRSVTSSPQG
jgi:hypothetical protein